MDGIIAVAIFAGVWWGLARYWRVNGKGTLVRHIGGFSGGFFALIIFAAVMGNKQAQEKSDQAATAVRPAAAAAPSVVETSVSAEKKKATATLDLTPTQYAKRFNGFMQDMDMPFRIKPTVTEGSVNDTFSSMLNDKLGVMGTVDRASGKLTAVTFIGSGDNTVKSGANVLLVSIATLAAAIPNGTIKNTTPEVTALIKDFKEGGNDSSGRIFNNVRLFYMRSKQFGNWFGAEAID